MTPYEIKKAVTDYLESNWTATNIREINLDDDVALPYIECYFLPGKTFAAEIGGIGERYGVFIINIFTKLDVGVDEGLTYGGLLEEMFKHRDIDGVVCDNGTTLPYTESMGVDDAISAYHHRVVVPFFVFS